MSSEKKYVVTGKTSIVLGTGKQVAQYQKGEVIVDNGQDPRLTNRIARLLKVKDSPIKLMREDASKDDPSKPTQTKV